MQRKHINALSRAVREAKAWRGGPMPEDRVEFDKFIKTAEEAMRFVRREFARQKGSE